MQVLSDPVELPHLVSVLVSYFADDYMDYFLIMVLLEISLLVVTDE